MTDRERLIELIKNAPTTDTVYGNIKIPNRIQTVQTIADHLLANGVFILPEDLRDTEDFSISAFIEAMQMYKEKDQYIKPPCKAGQTVWILFSIEKTIESREIKSIMQRQKSWTMRFTNGDCFTVWDNAEDEYFGKTVFLTKEQAENALKERVDNGTT